MNRHNKSPIDATRALIGRALVLMTLNPFERVAVSLKLVSMLLHSSSPPASLVFDVFFMRTNSQKTFENGIRVVTPVAGLIFETKNREIFLERFFWREIPAREQVSRAVILEKFQVIQ